MTDADTTVWHTATTFHVKKACAGWAYQRHTGTLAEAVDAGLDPCQRCVPDGVRDAWLAVRAQREMDALSESVPDE